MSPKFSQSLREKLIGYFEKYHGLTISDSQADEFLGSMSEFYQWFSDSGRGGRVRQDAETLPDSYT